MNENVNQYSRTWFEYFLETRPFTPYEVAFIQQHLPLPKHKKVLDICCGQGRISNALALEGYEIVGLDIDDRALEIARAEGLETAIYLHLDMRQLETVAGSFDAILLIWQSFGYFDEETNANIIQQISNKLRPGGRFILDIYNRAYWKENQSSGEFKKKETTIHFTNTMIGNRLTAQLNYGEIGGQERFEWQLYDLKEIRSLANRFDLNLILSCTEGQEAKSVTNTSSQMNLIFEKAVA